MNLVITNYLQDSCLLEMLHCTPRAGPVRIARKKVCTLKTLFSVIPEWEMAAETMFSARLWKLSFHTGSFLAFLLFISVN